MASRRDLRNYEYDSHLKEKIGHSREARKEMAERKARRTNKGIEGWHFGLGDQPVKTRDKAEFKRALDQRGLMMQDDVKRELK